jgi:hypothetical protein
LLKPAAWQLINQLGSKILIRFLFVMSRREAGFDCPDIWHSLIPVRQLPECLLADSLLHKQLVDTGYKKQPKQLLNIGEFPQADSGKEQQRNE